MTVRWLSAAEQDFSEALDFYLGESPQAAEQFCEEIDRSIALVQKKPTTFRILRRDLHEKILQRFPFSLLYFLDGNEIVIDSVVHHKRMPKIRRGRR
jgi:plasmid stabilization system protein ParE